MKITMQNKGYVGVDGCHYGWFAICLFEQGNFQIAKYPNITELWDANKDAALILIDIPIGLRDSGNEGRICDIEAHHLIEKRRSSVFPAPCRQAINTDLNKASNANYQRTGKYLSQQSINIIPKIKQVEELLSTDKIAQSCIKETHPELCFAMLNGREPMNFPKKRKQGFKERRKLLDALYKPSTEIIETACDCYYRKDVAKDDILDALAAAITALKSKGNLSAVGEDRPDSCGLPMKIHYYQTPSV